MAEQKVASWYWITTAALTPFALVATLMWVYYTHQVQANRAEGRQLVQKLQEDRGQWQPLITQMNNVATFTGFGLGEPDSTGVDAIEQPTPFSTEKERNAPAENRSPLLQYYLDAEKLFWGATAEEQGYLHDYVRARSWLDEFEDELEDYLAVKKYQYYTVDTIEVGGGEAAVASGDLSRSYVFVENTVSIPQADIDAARPDWEAGEPAADPVMREPIKITLELVFRKQSQLIQDLVAANHHQYALLLSGVADSVKFDGDTIYIGWRHEEESKTTITSDLESKRTTINDMKSDSIGALGDAGEIAEAAVDETGAKGINLQRMVVAAESRIEALQSSFEAEKTAHQQDAEKYDELIRNLPRLKNPIKLEKAAPDGEITYSDYSRGIVHINLGAADGVRVGQRFEVWRLHGRESDEFVGVIEIIRMLSSHFALCTVLSLTDEDDPIRKGDMLVSHLWHDGDFLTVALHGSYEPPNEAYSKERLAVLLKQKGLRVVERVQPGTDVVILGSRLLGDEWYREARSDLRFETLREDDVRLYVDPR